ncbi:MAG: leucine-rich repeat domain-containing protein, partial [Oscillospiraceae bacterium]|nr:leucine-rich repeat domain-containing protein [Oscillospiraceae bacterium]
PVSITLSDISYLRQDRIDLKAYDPYFERTQKGISTEVRASRKGTEYMYNIYDDHIELIKYIGLKRTVEIPSELEGLPVTHIGQDCFALAWRVKVSSIKIPDTVTTIYHGAFRGCQHIKELEIPDSVVYIGNYAFAFLTSLEHLEIPDSVISLGMGAFRNCSSLVTVKIPSGVLRIGNDCFYRCKFLEEVEIGCDVVDVDGWAFKCCERLKSVTIGSSVVNIGASAFYDCICLHKVDVPESVESIGEVAFHTRRGMTVGCYRDSVAEEYAIENKLRYEYIE